MPEIQSQIHPIRLRAEYLTDPLGLDTPEPRLSWELEARDPRVRGLRQTGWQIQAASTREGLLRGEANQWDSGRTESSETCQIPYAGTPLASRQERHWRVRVWDQDSRASEWSEPAVWTMGLLDASDWRSDWITLPAPPPPPDALRLDGCKWVWLPEGEPQHSAPAGSCYLRKTLDLSGKPALARARFLLTADDGFRLFVNGEPAGESPDEPEAWRTDRLFDISHRLRPGANVLAIEGQNHTEGPAGVLGILMIQFADGSVQAVPVDGGWRASAHAPEDWRQLDFDDTNWPAARETVAYREQPWWNPLCEHEYLHLTAPRRLRREFTVDGNLRRATVHVSALGIYTLRLNGQRVSEDRFMPGWTDYAKRVCYNTYDITDRLHKGANAVAATIADGWYAGYISNGRRREWYGRDPKLRLQIHLEYGNGREGIIVSGPGWRASTGPWLYADFQMGCGYDARREQPGWDRPGYDDGDWTEAVAEEVPAITMSAYPGTPARAQEPIEAVAVTEPAPGVHVFDLGQNFAGWTRLKVRGPAGTTLRLRFAERLQPDGQLYTENLRTARPLDTYILRGGEEEVWEPEFTFHGFRYAEITGFPGEPNPGSIAGIPVHADLQRAGAFECSVPLLNAIHRNQVWTHRSNYIEVPTDCPQRDERLGWLGDGQIFMRAAHYNYDIAAFARKWARDIVDAQMPFGAYTHTAPDAGTSHSSPGWAEAGVIAPWLLHEFHGDRRVLAEHWESMVRFMDFKATRATDNLMPDYGFGDWLAFDGATSTSLIGTAYYAYACDLMSRIAGILDRTGEAAKYRALFEYTAAAFQRAFVQADGTIGGNSQTGYVLALAFGLLSDDLRPRALERLVNDIRTRGHLTTGILGTRDLLHVLSRSGRHEIAVELALQTRCPSWGYMVEQGATTIWERWDSWTHDKGFQTPAMNSFNHPALGAIGAWMIEDLAGIRPETPGFTRVRIQPRPAPPLEWVRASCHTIRGPLTVDWRLDQRIFRLSVSLPPNMSATVVLPGAGAIAVDGGAPDSVPGLHIRERTGSETILDVPPGSWSFTAEL